MTAQDLFSHGVRKIRLPEWNVYAYIDLGNLSCFPSWVILYDVGCNGMELPAWKYTTGDTWLAWEEPTVCRPGVYDPLPH